MSVRVRREPKARRTLSIARADGRWLEAGARWVAGPTPLDLTQITDLQFHVYTNEQTPVQYHFCISDIYAYQWSHAAEPPASFCGRAGSGCFVTYLGYPGSTGLSVFSGRITDVWADRGLRVMSTPTRARSHHQARRALLSLAVGRF